MKLLFKVILSVLCFSPSYSLESHIEKCSIFNNDLRSRPDTDTTAPSPSGYFLIHYDTTGEHAPSQSNLDGNSIPDYIDEVGIIADSSRYVLVNMMGFLSEIPDSDGVYDIYIQDRASGYYGVNYQDDIVPGASYIIIDNAYEPGEFLTTGVNTMRLTVAHEFFHAIQRSYRTVPSSSDTYFWEMSSTWIEDVIVPDGDDYLYWVSPFFNSPDQKISDTDGYSIALFGHYLSSIIDNSPNQFNSNILREMWNKYSDTGNSFYSIDHILSTNYNTDFSTVWLDFLSRNHFNGLYNNDNNDFYYYLDQQHLSPISTSVNFLDEDTSIELIVSEQSAAFKTFYVNDGGAISLSDSIIPSSSSYNGTLSIISNNLNLNSLRFIPIGSSQSITYLDQGTYIHFSYSGYGDAIVNVNIDFESEINIINGDLNFDQSVNVQDIILMVEFILNDTAFNQFQFEAGDINLDDYCNIFDIIMILDIILN